MIFQTVEKGKEGKETSEKKAGGGKAMHLCAAKCRPRGECRKKRVATAPAGAYRSGAKPPDHRAESAALSAQTPLFHLK